MAWLVWSLTSGGGICPSLHWHETWEEKWTPQPAPSSQISSLTAKRGAALRSLSREWTLAGQTCDHAAPSRVEILCVKKMWLLVITDAVLRKQNVKVDSYYKTRAVQKTHCGELNIGSFVNKSQFEYIKYLNTQVAIDIWEHGVLSHTFEACFNYVS